MAVCSPSRRCRNGGCVVTLGEFPPPSLTGVKRCRGPLQSGFWERSTSRISATNFSHSSPNGNSRNGSPTSSSARSARREQIPTHLDGGHPAEELGPCEPTRCAQLAQELDCLLIGGGGIIHTRDQVLSTVYGVSAEELLARRPSDWFIDGLGAELEQACPVIWHGVGIPFEPTAEETARLRRRAWLQTLRDSPRRNERAAIAPAAGVSVPVSLVPDSAFMVNRLLPSQPVVRRRAFHRQMGWIPTADEPILVVQGNRDLVRFAPQIAAALRIWLTGHPDVRVVIAELGPCHGDGEFADALEPMLPRRSSASGGPQGLRTSSA